MQRVTSRNIDRLAESPWLAIDDLMKKNAEPTGSEWFTIEQFMIRYHLGYAASTDRLKTKDFEMWRGTSSETKRTILKFRLKKKRR